MCEGDTIRVDGTGRRRRDREQAKERVDEGLKVNGNRTP